jgi:hypothetical protein
MLWVISSTNLAGFWNAEPLSTFQRVPHAKEISASLKGVSLNLYPKPLPQSNFSFMAPVNWLNNEVSAGRNSGFEHKVGIAINSYGDLWYVYSSSKGVSNNDTLHIFCSSDGGNTWLYVGNLASANPTKGIFEPYININPTDNYLYVIFTFGMIPSRSLGSKQTRDARRFQGHPEYSRLAILTGPITPR